MGFLFCLFTGSRHEDSNPSCLVLENPILRAREKIRTPDLRFTKALLYQLSYSGSQDRIICEKYIILRLFTKVFGLPY